MSTVPVMVSGVTICMMPLLPFHSIMTTVLVDRKRNRGRHDNLVYHYKSCLSLLQKKFTETDKKH